MLSSCLISFILITILNPSHARIGFKKDQSTDKIDFPPTLGKTPQGVPLGHLRPLGWQRRPDGGVLEAITLPEPEEFYDTFVSQKKPVVFREALSEEDVPAMITWTQDGHLKKNYGFHDIHVIVKREYLSKGPKKMKFKKFLKEYQYEDWYLTNAIPEEMMHELVLPKCLACGMRRHLVESEIWMSSGGTSSLLHSHADHNLHCVLAGRKDFILINPKFKERLFWVDDPIHPNAGRSEMDVDRVNMFKHKQISQIPWVWSTLTAGDCIYIPDGFPHQVRSYGRSFSSTMLWAPMPSIHFADCVNTDLDEVIPLNQAVFMWTYTHGDMELSNTKLTAKSLKHYLFLLMRTEENLRYELFRSMYKEVMSVATVHIGAQEAWAILSPNGEKTLSRDAVETLSEEALTALAEVFNKAHEHKTSHEEL